MKVKLAEHAGYCYGVERALKLAQQAAKSDKNCPKPIYTLGPIIHNPQVVESLKKKGILDLASLDQADKGTIIIRSHGIDPKIVDRAKKKGMKVIDATCPFVKKAQHCASELVKDGYDLVIIGDRNHPEVIGILAHAKDKAFVVEKVKDLHSFSPRERVGIVVQTTQSEENLKRIINYLLPRIAELKVFNTICDATTKRQMAARKLARQVEIMLVVGGKNSANTSRLAQICQESGATTYHIETAEEIDRGWFKKDSFVGITAGASTPNWILEEVVKRLEEIG